MVPLHCEAPLRFSSPFRSTTYTRTGGFCLRKILGFSSGRTQNPPVLWPAESVRYCPEQPLSATHGRQRYNTLDLAITPQSRLCGDPDSKVVCHETAGFIGFFLPLKGAALHWMPPAKAAPPPLETTAKGYSVPFGILSQQGVLSPLLETQSQRNLPSLWNPRCVLECVPTKKK